MNPADRIGQLIRNIHPYAFRSGEWAQIIKIKPVLPSGLSSVRECYLIEFPDGLQDKWPINDLAAEYQFATIEKAQK